LSKHSPQSRAVLTIAVGGIALTKKIDPNAATDEIILSNLQNVTKEDSQDTTKKDIHHTTQQDITWMVANLTNPKDIEVYKNKETIARNILSKERKITSM
jgi:hypothetical protein